MPSLEHIWPELMGGFVGYWLHHVKHLIFRLITGMVRRVFR